MVPSIMASHPGLEAAKQPQTITPKESSSENGAQLKENKTRGFSYCLVGKYAAKNC